MSNSNHTSSGAADRMRVSTDYGEVILDSRTGRYWRLNETAAHILDVIDKGGDEEDAIAFLVSNYNVDAARARREVVKFRKSAKEGGLL